MTDEKEWKRFKLLWRLGSVRGNSFALRGTKVIGREPDKLLTYSGGSSATRYEFLDNKNLERMSE